MSLTVHNHVDKDSMLHPIRRSPPSRHSRSREGSLTVREANARIAKAVPRTAQGIVAATTDGIHLTSEDYARWLAAIERAACGGG